MQTLKDAILILHKLKLSRFRQIKLSAKCLIILCQSRKRISKKLWFKVENVELQNQKLIHKSNCILIKKDAKIACLTNAIQLTVLDENSMVNTRHAKQILSNQMCLISYFLVKKSNTTQEKSGELTTRLATSMPEFWHEYKCQLDGIALNNGAIRYKDEKLQVRSFRKTELNYIYPLSDKLTYIFKKATKEEQLFYAKIFSNQLNKIQLKFKNIKNFS